MIIGVDILYKNRSTFNLYTKNIPSSNLYGVKSNYMDIIKNITIFNKTTKNLKNKDNSRKIFINTTLNNTQSIFYYNKSSNTLAIYNLKDHNSIFNENPTGFIFYQNITLK